MADSYDAYWFSARSSNVTRGVVRRARGSGGAGGAGGAGGVRGGRGAGEARGSGGVRGAVIAAILLKLWLLC